MNGSLTELIIKAQEDAFTGWLNPTKNDIYLRTTAEAVRERYGVEWSQILSNNRREDIVRARHFALTALSSLTGLGDSALAHFVGIDRGRIIFARNKLNAYFAIYADERREFGALLSEIRKLAGEE